MSANWIAGLSEDERHIVIGCLLHTLHDIDSTYLVGRSEAAEALTAELDRWINDQSAMPTGFVAKIPEDAREPLWASMWATVLNIHQPQDNLPASGWKALERALALVDQFDADRSSGLRSQPVT